MPSRFSAPLTVVSLLAALCACSDLSDLEELEPPQSNESVDQVEEINRANPTDPMPHEVAAPAPAEWTSYRGDRGLRGVARGELETPLALRWTFKTEGAIVSSAVIAGGRAFFGSDDAKLYALDLESGELAWSFTTEDMIEAPPLVRGDTLYVGSSDYFLYALDIQTGELRWRVETADKIVGSANWVAATEESPELIVFGSFDNSLYALNADDGTEVWHYETADHLNGTPAILGDSIVFGGCDSVLHLVSAKTGKGLSTLPLGAGCQVAGSVGLYDGKAYFGHYGNAFVCVDLEASEILWSYFDEEYPFISSPSITEDRVIFGGQDKQLHCVKRTDGTPLWSFATRRKLDASPVVCGDKVVFGSGDGWLRVLGLQDGTEVWSYEIGQGIFASPAVAGGMVLIGSLDKHMYAFGPPLTDER